MVDFDREVRVLQGFTNDRAALEQAIRRTTAGGSTSLYNAIYIALKELKKTARQQRAGDSPPGDRRPVGRRGHVEPGQLRPGARPRQAVGNGDLLDRPADEGRTARAGGSRRPSSCCGSWPRKRAAAPSSPTRIEDLAGVYGQIADELASQYSLGYASKNARRDGAWRRVVVRVDREGATARTKQGYFGPNRRWAPSLWAGEMTHAERRLSASRSCSTPWPACSTPSTSPPATRRSGARRPPLLAAGALAHTFVIGMQTMEAGHVPIAGTTQAISTFVLAARAGVPVHGDDDRGARARRVHRAAAGRAAGHPRAEPGGGAAGAESSRARGSACTWRRCCSPTPASRWRA